MPFDWSGKFQTKEKKLSQYSKKILRLHHDPRLRSNAASIDYHQCPKSYHVPGNCLPCRIDQLRGEQGATEVLLAKSIRQHGRDFLLGRRDLARVGRIVFQNSGPLRNLYPDFSTLICPFSRTLFSHPTRVCFDKVKV